jgi:hypothetical protein
MTWEKAAPPPLKFSNSPWALPSISPVTQVNVAGIAPAG